MKTIKCVVIGDTYVGKTSLLITYTTNNFLNEYIPTIIDNHTMKINIDNEKQILLDLWDCARQKCRHYSPNIPIILVATKIDKRDDKDIKDKLKQDKLNPISYEQGHTLMKKIKAIQYLECSALTKQGLKIVFDEAVKVAIANDPFEKYNQTSNCIIF
ncbi:hypothetical protein ACTFIT_008025 [Dictyostelium discoideum]